MAMDLIIRGYRLTTVEILYHLPDYPDLIQSFVWQDYDLPPQFPRLQSFLQFWEKSIDAKLHSVSVVAGEKSVVPNIVLTEFSKVLH